MKFVRILLFPFSVIYDLITSIRNFFFDIGLFKETSFKIPVIVVGNLSVGGTGKTPQIEYLIRLLKENFKLAVLSRGYKRKTKGFVLLNKDHSVQDAGDEPLQYFKKFKNIDVAVDENRVEGIDLLIKQKKTEIVLLDDAFQHRKVKGSFYILITKYDALFTNDFLLPTGNLRESKRGARRADIILIAKCPENLGLDKQKEIKNKLKNYKKEVFFTTISYATQLSGSSEILVNELKNYEVLLITGIANPAHLLNFLNEKQVNFKHLKFADHHHFSSSEIINIQKEFHKISSPKKIILTTEKDYTRLVHKLEKVSFLAIEISFLENKNERFNSIIKSHVSEIKIS